MSDNFQDQVGLRSDSNLHASGNALYIGSSAGSKSLVFSNAAGEGHLVMDPTGVRTVVIPDVDGTLAYKSDVVATMALGAGTQTATSGTVVLSDSNNVTFGMSGSTRITASASFPPETPFGISAGTQSVSTGTLVFSDSNNVSFGMSGSSRVTASIPAGATATGNFGAISAGTQQATSGTVVFSDSNNVTFGMSGSTRVTASIPAGATATGNLGAIAAGTQTATSGTIVFSDSNGISFGMSGSTRVTASTNAVVSGFGVSTAGNTQGNTGTRTGSVVLVGTNNITLSQNTDANGVTVSISGGGGGAGFSGGVSNLGNTAGSTGVTGTRLVLVGTNNVTLSQSTDANGGTVSISAAGGGAGQFSGGVSNLGNTAGSTGVTGTRLVLVGTNNITLSQSTDANGGTISISDVGAVTLSYWDNVGLGPQATNALTGKAHQNATLMIFPLDGADRYFPGAMTVSTMMLNFSQSGSTATVSAAHTTSISFGMYLRTNSTQLTLVNSVSTSYGAAAAATNNSTIAQGQRWLTFHSSQWSSEPVMSQDVVYYGALWIRSSNASAQSMSVLGQYIYSTASRSGTIGVNSASNTSLGFGPFLGIYSASFTTAMPGSIAYNVINKAAASVNFQPHVVFNNLTAII